MRLTQAAALFCGQSHQIAALNWLESLLTTEQWSQFVETFNAGPLLPEEPSSAMWFQRYQQQIDHGAPADAAGPPLPPHRFNLS